MSHTRRLPAPSSAAGAAASNQSRKNTVNFNRFHSVPLLLHVGDEVGLPSTHATREPYSHQRLLEEPFIDQRALDAQKILDRIHLLLLSKDKAMRALHDARDQCSQQSMLLVGSSDNHVAMSLADPSNTAHAEYVADAFAQLRSAKELVEHAHKMFLCCDNDLRRAEKELRMLYDSSELLCVAQDQEEERAELRYLAEKDNGPNDATQPRGGDGGGGHTPALSSDCQTPAAASSPLVDEAIERHTLERLNRDATSLGMFDIALRMIRAPHTWGKTERGIHVMGLVVALQSGYRAYRTRRRFANLKKARRSLDMECASYQFYFYRRYVAAVRLYRECLMRLGFYPLLGHANLASLRRGAFALHATRARENATVQRVFLLWRQLARYQRAPLLVRCSNAQLVLNATTASHHGTAMAVAASERSTVLSRSTSSSSATTFVDVGWWERDAPFVYDLPPWDVFLQQEHLRAAMKRIGLPVFGGASNRYLMCAHILKRWQRFVAVEKRVRAGWDIAVRHDRRACRSKHFFAWMDVVSFTMQREAQAVAKTALYFGVWRRLVQRAKHELRATAALVPLKKMQMLNRWRQRVVRLRLQRAASNLLIFAHRPVTLYCMYAMLGRRQEAVFVKLWRWWRAYTMRRRNFKSLIGLGWQRRSKQLARVVLLGWHNATKPTALYGDATIRHATSPNTAHAPVLPSSGLFAPTVSEFGDDVRMLDMRRAKEPLFKALHQTEAALEALGPPPTETIVRSTGGHTDAPMVCNPHDCFLPKEIAPIPSAHAMEAARQHEVGCYLQWHALHTTAVVVGGRQPSPLESPTSPNVEPFAWTTGQPAHLRRCPKDKHFLINFFVFATQKHKRERQAQAYQQQQSSAADATAEVPTTDDSVGVPTASTGSAGASNAYCTRMLSFVLTVGAPLAQPATNEWNVQNMEAFFEDHCRYNYIIQKKKEIRDGRIERKIDMRLAAIRFAEVNPFFTCHALTARNIGFSPYQHLLEEYMATTSGGKKRGSVSKKKKSIASPVKKGKFRIPLPFVPVRRQLPFLVRAHLHQIVESDDSQAHMLEQRYVRAKVQRAGLLMALAKRHPSPVDTTRNEGIAGREVVLSRYVAAEEKDFTESVVARKMHELVDPAAMQCIERLPIEIQILNLLGFNPKFLRGTMQQRTRRIGLIRAFMKAQGKFYFKTMNSRCELVPMHQWACKREAMLDQQEKDAGDAASEGDAELEGDEGRQEQGLRQLQQKTVEDHRQEVDDSDSDDEEWKPTRAQSMRYLSEAVAVVERNATWDVVSRRVPASCPDSPMQRELVLRAPTPATPQAVGAITPDETVNPIDTYNPSTRLSFPSHETTPRVALDGDRTSGSGFSPFVACGPSEEDGLSLGEAAACDELTPEAPASTSRSGSLPSSADSSTKRRDNEAENINDISTTDDDDDDDPRMIAARQIKPSGKPARTLAEREKGRRSILGTQSSSQMTSIARMQSISGADAAQAGAGARRVTDDEEVDVDGEGVAQSGDATVDAFACAAIHNGPKDGADDQMQGTTEEAAVTVTESLGGGAVRLSNGMIQLADGNRIIPGPPSRVVTSNGETIESSAANNFSITSDGRIRLSDGRVAPVEYVAVINGLVQLQPGCLILADGSVIRVESGAYRIDGKVRLANGRLVDASRAALDDNGALMLASERFLVQRKAAQQQQEKGVDADDSDASTTDDAGRAAFQRQGASRGPGTVVGSLFSGARRTNWRIPCPRLWDTGALDAAASIPAMERLMEISGRFNYYLNASTRHELDRLKQHVLRAIAKLDPAAAKADREVKAAERRIASLRGGSGHAATQGKQATDDNRDAAVDPTPPAAVQPSEFVLPCVTIESARHHKALPASAHMKAPATATAAGVQNASTTTGDGGGGRAASAPSFFVPEAVALHKRIVEEAQMVLVDAQPIRKESGPHAYRSMEETATLANMRSTADLINDVPLPAQRPPSGNAGGEGLNGWVGGQLSATAIEADVLRKHRRCPTATTLEAQHGGSGKMPMRLRSAVEGRHPKVAEVQGSAGAGCVVGDDADGDAFQSWLTSMADKMQHHHTRTAATEALEMQRQMLQRKLSQTATLVAPSSPGGGLAGLALRASSRRLVVHELQDRLDAVVALLTNARCTFTTTELFDSAVDKRSFTGPLIRRPASSSSLQPPRPIVHHQQPSPASASVVAPVPSAVVAEALSDAEVGRLVQFLQQASTHATKAKDAAGSSSRRRRAQ